MHTFKVVKERFGWAVRLGDGMTTPFRTRVMALQQADHLCQALRRHGEAACVVVDAEEPEPASEPADPTPGARSGAFWRSSASGQL